METPDPASVVTEDMTLSVLGRRIAARRLTPPGTGHGDDAARGPVIVFLHEALGSIGQWKDFPQRVCARTGLPGLVYDRLGYGGSDPLEAARTPDYLRAEGEEWLPAVLEAAGISAPPILFGHSDGGSIALYFAAAHPTATMITEAAHIFVEEITLQGIRDFGTQLWEATNVRDKLARYHGDKTEAVYRAWHDTWLRPEFAAFDMTDRLPFIACPSLILQGENDEYGSARQVTETVAGIQSGGRGTADGRFLPACGHVPHLEQKDEVAGIAAGFIRQVFAL